MGSKSGWRVAAWPRTQGDCGGGDGGHCESFFKEKGHSGDHLLGRASSQKVVW